MDRNKAHLWALSLWVILFLAGCSGGMPEATPSPYPAQVSWEIAVEILQSGNVEMVMQAHSLDVTLIMRDGSQIHTVEPEIDAIFSAIQECGAPCSQIIQATE